MTTPPDDRSPLAKAYQRASRGVAVAIGMVMPGMVGYMVDSRIGTRAVFTILGFAAGMSYGIWELVRLGRSGGSDGGTSRRKEISERPKRDS